MVLGFLKSGGHGALSNRFSELHARLEVAAQVLVGLHLAHFLMTAVICGCLVLSGIKSSTVLAHSLACLPPTAIRCGRNKKYGPPTGDDEVGTSSYSRYSSDLQNDTSIRDQQRSCQEKATANGHEILPALEFVDEAVSGTKLHRDGLDAMLQAAEEGRIKVLYLHSLSRLARESVITMPLLKRLVHVDGVRVIVASEGIDSDREGWEIHATLISWVHERYVKDLAANVFRGQEGTVLDGFSVGDPCYGYTTAPIPGSEAARRGKHAKPRMRYEIDIVTAAWVARIFCWYAVERRSNAWIVRELNRLRAPKGHGDITGVWRYDLVIRILRNRKYIGEWAWGKSKTVRNPLTGQVRREPRPEHEFSKWNRTFEHLRLIDDDTFMGAQARLDESSARYSKVRDGAGQLRGSQAGVAARQANHLLSGLVVCAKCGATMQVGGSHGQYLLCPRHKNDLCTCKTQLRIDLAQQLILDAIGRRIREDVVWRAFVYQATCSAWESQARTIPDELSSAERHQKDILARKSRLLDRIESGTASADVDQRLAERNKELETLDFTIRQLRKRAAEYGPPPTKEFVDEQLERLGGSITHGDPAAADALRRLVGGRVTVFEVERSGRKRHFFRGEFTLSTAVLLSSRVEQSSAVDEFETSCETISIDFIAADPYEGQMNRVKKLYDQGWLEKRIAEELGLARSRVTLLLKRWHLLHGEEMIDGRKRRSQLDGKQLVPPKYQAISDEVKRLCDEGHLMFEVGERLGCSTTLITKAYNYWFTSRGQTPLDGRVRRKELSRKVSHPRAKPTPNEAA